jgi:hypothetical protein
VQQAHCVNCIATLLDPAKLFSVKKLVILFNDALPTWQRNLHKTVIANSKSFTIFYFSSRQKGK